MSSCSSNGPSPPPPEVADDPRIAEHRPHDDRGGGPVADRDRRARLHARRRRRGVTGRSRTAAAHRRAVPGAGEHRRDHGQRAGRRRLRVRDRRPECRSTPSPRSSPSSASSWATPKWSASSGCRSTSSTIRRPTRWWSPAPTSLRDAARRIELGTIVWLHLHDPAMPPTSCRTCRRWSPTGTSRRRGRCSKRRASRRLQRNGLLIAGAVVGLTGLLAIAQAVARHLAPRRGDSHVLAAIGLTPAARRHAGLLAVAPADRRSLIALPLALLASPSAPARPGPPRRSRPRPPRRLARAAVGLAVALVAVWLCAVVAVRRWVRPNRQTQTVAHRRIARVTATLGLRPVPSVGSNLALASGRGPARLPVVPMLAVLAATTAVVAGALAIRSSLVGLTGDAERYGQPWDVFVDVDPSEQRDVGERHRGRPAGRRRRGDAQRRGQPRRCRRHDPPGRRDRSRGSDRPDVAGRPRWQGSRRAGRDRRRHEHDALARPLDRRRDDRQRPVRRAPRRGGRAQHPAAAQRRRSRQWFGPAAVDVRRAVRGPADRRDRRGGRRDRPAARRRRRRSLVDSHWPTSTGRSPSGRCRARSPCSPTCGRSRCASSPSACSG